MLVWIQKIHRQRVRTVSNSAPRDLILLGGLTQSAAISCWAAFSAFRVLLTQIQALANQSEDTLGSSGLRVRLKPLNIQQVLSAPCRSLVLY